MKVLSAEFVTSAAAGAPAGIPRGVPQIALVGRSNVGKSTLINALCRRKVARTSAAPGKTRLANFYRVTLDDGGRRTRELYFVDLPGYGYARGGAESSQELKAVAEGYLGGERLRPERPFDDAQGRPEHVEGRGARPPSESERGWGPASAEKSRPGGVSEPPNGVLLLIDSRHPGLESDISAHEWLRSLGLEPRIVATKIDKLSRSERARNLNTLADTFGAAAVPVSAQSGEGLNELWQLIIRQGKNR